MNYVRKTELILQFLNSIEEHLSSVPEILDKSPLPSKENRTDFKLIESDLIKHHLVIVCKPPNTNETAGGWALLRISSEGRELLSDRKLLSQLYPLEYLENEYKIYLKEISNHGINGISTLELSARLGENRVLVKEIINSLSGLNLIQSRNVNSQSNPDESMISITDEGKFAVETDNRIVELLKRVNKKERMIFKSDINNNTENATTNYNETEREFLHKEFQNIRIQSLGLDESLAKTIESRFDEIHSCLSAQAYLATIILTGSCLEGILLGIANRNPKIFNQTKCAAKDKDNQVKHFSEWSLSQFINAAFEIGYIEKDVKEFSSSLREFRNYIHPYNQTQSQFYPNQHTAAMCFQVLKAALYQIERNIGKSI